MNTSVWPSSMRTGMLTIMARLGMPMRCRTPLSISVAAETSSSWRQAMRNVADWWKTDLPLIAGSGGLTTVTAGLDLDTITPLHQRRGPAGAGVWRVYFYRRSGAGKGELFRGAPASGVVAGQQELGVVALDALE